MPTTYGPLWDESAPPEPRYPGCECVFTWCETFWLKGDDKANCPVPHTKMGTEISGKFIENIGGTVYEVENHKKYRAA
jgi:hypothetical protein